MFRLYLALAALAVCAAPALLNLSPTAWRVGSLFFLAVIIASGLHVVLGLTRIVSLCHFALVGVGAYTGGYLSLHQYTSPFLSVILGAVAAGTVAFALAFLTRTLADHYLTLATLAGNEILLNVFRSATKLTGGVNGMSGVPPLSLMGHELSQPAMYYPVAACAGLAITFFVRQLESWPLGHALRVMGDLGSQVASLGISESGLRMRGFLLGGVLAGFAGGLMAHIDGFVGPESFGVGYSVLYICFLVLFGVGRLRGVFATASVTVLIAEALRALFAWQMVIVSAATIIAMIARRVPRRVPVLEEGQGG